MTSKQQCPKCAAAGRDSSGDNLVDFGDHKHCFACGYHEGSESNKSRVSRKMPDLTPITEFPNRTYLSKIAVKWGVLAEPIKTRAGSKYTKKHSLTLAFPYFDLKGVLTGLKGRNFRNPKSKGTFWYKGFTDFSLFGLHMVKHDAVLLVEGEPDTLCCASVFEKHGIKCDVLGVSGTDNITKIETIAKFIREYKEIYLGFDQDEAGQTCTDKAISLLPEYKVQVVSWTKKDPCDVFEVKGADGILECLEYSEKIASVDLIAGNTIKSSYMTHLQAGQLSGFKSTYPGLDAMVGGSLKRGEALIFGAHTGLGKSTFVLNWAHSIVCNNETKVLWAGSEMLHEEMVHKLVELDLRNSVEYRDGVLQGATFKEIDESLNFVMDNFIFYNGVADMDSLLDAAESAVYSHGVGLVVVDVLDDYLPQKWEDVRPAVKKLKDFAQGSPKDKRPPVAVIMVSHTKQRDGKYGSSIRIDDLSGGVQRIQQATCVIGMDGVIGETERTLKILKLPRMGDSHQSEVEVVYLSDKKSYEEVDQDY